MVKRIIAWAPLAGQLLITVICPLTTGEKYNTYGGYSDSIIIKEHFVLKIPDSLYIKSAAQILCTDITTYSPLKHWVVGGGSRVGVAGLGGLGHMVVKPAVGIAC